MLKTKLKSVCKLERTERRNMYDFRKEPSVHGNNVKGFYRKHEKKFRKFLRDQSKETLCRLWCELSDWQWNEEILGPFKGDLAAGTLMAAIDDKIGHYELLRYANVVYHKRMTEEEYFRWVVKYCYDCIERPNNPLYW